MNRNKVALAVMFLGLLLVLAELVLTTTGSGNDHKLFSILGLILSAFGLLLLVLNKNSK
jgi:LPXTG-motif cell wall-anchored protein